MKKLALSFVLLYGAACATAFYFYREVPVGFFTIIISIAAAGLPVSAFFINMHARGDNIMGGFICIQLRYYVLMIAIGTLSVIYGYSVDKNPIRIILALPYLSFIVIDTFMWPRYLWLKAKEEESSEYIEMTEQTRFRERKAS